MSRQMEKRIKEELRKLDDIADELEFYNEEKIRVIALHLIKQYSTLLKSNMQLIKKLNNKGVLNGKI